MTIEGFACNINIKPMAQWLQEGDNPENAENCHICRIRPLAEYYMGALEEAGAKEHLEALENAWTTGEGLTVAETMDKIKSAVGETLRKELEELDCYAQTFEETAEEQQQ